MTIRVPSTPIDYRVENVPTSVRGKITQFAGAAMEYALRRTLEPRDADDVEEYYHVARYELERTVKTLLDREKRKPRTKR